MSYTYYLNGFDFSNLVYNTPLLTKKVGKGSKTLTNDISINILNEDNLFSPENSESLLYGYRGNYFDIEIEIKDGEDLIWKGILDNISREPLFKTATLLCVEVTIKALSVNEFYYFDGDGYSGDQAFAGSTATPAEHQLALLRRFVFDDNIDLGSFKILKNFQIGESISCDCNVKSVHDKQYSPLSFIQDLMLNTGYIGIYKSKIFVKLYESFLGDYGTILNNDIIISINHIEKSKQSITDPYSSYSIIYDNSGVPTVLEDSYGDSGTTTGLSSTYLEDNTKTWEINEWKDKYIFIDTYEDKQILKITGSNITKLFFSGCTKTSPMDYVICETDKIFNQDWSDYPIKLNSGASIIGSYILTKNVQNHLEIEIQIFDTMNLDVGDIITLTVESEGITMQPFEITQIKKELFGNISTLTCLDCLMYPLLSEFEITIPTKVTGLTGLRNSDGSALLSWTNQSGVSYYKIYYGATNPDFTFITSSYTDVNIVDHLAKWLGYYFWVSAINFYGIEGEKSDSLFLDKISQESGYIDGSEGYLIEKYQDWGYLEDYFYSLTYKQISNADTGFLLKNSLVVLDRSQKTSISEISQPFSDKLALQGWGQTFRRLGYTDGAGTSTYLPEFFNDSETMKIKNSLNKKLTLNLPSLGVTVIDPGDEIPGSENWFLKYSSSYYTYWFQSGYMLDPFNTDYIEWYKVFRINQSMGIFEIDTAILTVDTDLNVGTLTDNTKTWKVDQWLNYYIGIVKNAGSLEIVWAKITANTATTLTFPYSEDSTVSQKYIINNEPYVGFQGLFFDDIWTNLYLEGVSSTDYENDYLANHGEYYWESMANFLEILVEHIENRSNAFYGDWVKAEKGLVMVNTWPENWSAYPYYVAAINKRYRHFIMFEALQSTWSMANEVTKQYIILDWYEAIQRFAQMKIDAGVGYSRLATLGYPCHLQMMFSHIAGSLLLSRYSDRIEDITAVGNIILDQLFYDMVMAGNIKTLKTIGIPRLGYEDSYIQDFYDRYGIIVRKFEGCFIFYNPSRQIRSIDYTFDYDVVNFFTGEEFDINVPYTILLQGRSALFFYADNDTGLDAYNFLRLNKPFTYIDSNISWVIFTQNAKLAGITTNSVWMENGYTGLKKLTLNGSPIIPEGNLYELFHAGNGTTTKVTGYTPETESITGGNIGDSVLLTSLTIYAVVLISQDGGATWIDADGNSTSDWAGADYLTDTTKSWTPDQFAGRYLSIESGDTLNITGNSETVIYFSDTNTNTGASKAYSIGYNSFTKGTAIVEGTDYLVEHKEWDATSSGKGKWKTYIYFLTDQHTETLDVYYFEYGLEDGYPRYIRNGEQAEFGLIYRKNSGFKLLTGDINQIDATDELTEGTDYFIIPEITRHKWDYRFKNPFGQFLEDKTFTATFSLNSIYNTNNMQGIKGIHWGSIDPENALLVNASQSDSDCGVNGKKAIYASKTIVRPKVLIYGFTKTIRDGDLATILPESRVYDQWLYENQLKKFEGIYYDEVTITGDWDGVINTGSDKGYLGSIKGMLDDPGSGFDTWEDIADYFDVIILNDTFMESGIITEDVDGNIACTEILDGGYTINLVDESKTFLYDEDSTTIFYLIIEGYIPIRILFLERHILYIYNNSVTQTLIGLTPAYSIIKTRTSTGILLYGSWMGVNDYFLIKNFKKRAIQNNRDTLLIDRRSGALAFANCYITTDPPIPEYLTTYRGINYILIVKGIPVNHSVYSNPNISDTTKAAMQYLERFYTDLTDVFGCYTYAGISVADLYNEYSETYVKTGEDTYAKYDSTMLTDFRVGKKIDVTQHYDFDEFDPTTHPKYNIWENEGSWISYIPKTKTGRQYFGDTVIYDSEDTKHENSNLYVKWKDITSSILIDFYKYEPGTLYDILLRREPVLIYHSYDFFNNKLDLSVAMGYFGDLDDEANFGNNQSRVLSSFLDAATYVEDVGKFRGILISKPSSELESFFVGKYIFLLESTSEEFDSSFKNNDPNFKGYAGNYISTVTKSLIQYRNDYQILDAGWVADDNNFESAYQTHFFEVKSYEEDAVIDFGNMLIFDSWNSELSKILPLSRTFNPSGAIPYKRNLPTPFEGNILSIVKNTNTIDIEVDFDISGISVESPTATGYVTGRSSGEYYITGDGSNDSARLLYTDISDMTPYNGFYMYLYYNSEVITFKIYTGFRPHSNEFYVKEKDLPGNASFPTSDMIGCYFELHEDIITYKLATFRTDSDYNLVYNAKILSKNNTNQTLTINLHRGVAQVSSGGGCIVYIGEDSATSGVSNRDILGGRLAGVNEVVGADIYATKLNEGAVDETKGFDFLESAGMGGGYDKIIEQKPMSIQHYEWAYGPYIQEFGYEKNTGLITCHSFYAHGATTRPPVLIWPGISIEDTHEIISKLIGIKIVYTDLQVKANDVLYLYYNSWNDILKINSEDVENVIDGFSKFDTLKTSDKTLQKALAKGYKS